MYLNYNYGESESSFLTWCHSLILTIATSVITCRNQINLGKMVLELNLWVFSCFLLFKLTFVEGHGLTAKCRMQGAFKVSGFAVVLGQGEKSQEHNYWTLN